MRIVHLVLSGDVAGGQLVALRLAKAARARGDDVSFVSPTAGPFLETVEREGIPTYVVDVSRTFKVGGAIRLWRLLRTLRADIVHTHGAIAVNALGRMAGRLAGAAVVSHMHIENHLPPGRMRRSFVRALDNVTARLCARILPVSDTTRLALEGQGYPTERMERVYNGIDTSGATAPRQNGLRAELGIPGDALLAGEIGRLCAVKGQRELIQAAARIPDLHVLLVGEDLEAGGAFGAQLERERDALGLSDRVVLAGHVRDAASALAELDIFVLPSWIEGLPLVVLEAMAQGVPVVATAVGGTPEAVIDGETGLLVPAREPEALAAAIERLVTDRELARRLGEAGRRRVVESFSARAMEERVLEVYDEVVAG